MAADYLVLSEEEQGLMDLVDPNGFCVAGQMHSNTPTCS